MSAAHLTAYVLQSSLILGVGLVTRVPGLRQGDRHALLQHRRDQHHDDEQHQHDIDQRRHVDFRIQTAS